MADKKSSSSVWWPKKYFNWSNSKSSAANETPEVSDRTSEGSLESQDIYGSNSKYLNLLVKRVRKGLKISSDADTDRLTPWMSDSNAKQCYECGEKFTTIRRRHHCRVCGQIFCTKCCGEEIDTRLLGLTNGGSVRACNYCHKIVNQYIDDKNVESSTSVRDQELSQFREILLSKSFADNSNVDQTDSLLQTRSSEPMPSNSITSPYSSYSLRRKGSIGFREEDYAKPKLRALEINKEMNQISGSSPSPLYTFSSFGSYKTTVRGSESSDDEVMPLKNDETSHEPLWVKEINDDIESQSFEKIDSSSELMNSTDSYGPESRRKSLSRKIAYSTSTYDIELDLEKDRVSVSKANRSEVNDDRPVFDESDAPKAKPGASDGLSIDFEVTTSSLNWKSLREGTEEKSAYDSLNCAYNNLYKKLLTQMLEEEGISLTWINVIQAISAKVSSVVRPNSYNDIEEMDIRNYVKIKIIPNGVKSDSHIINGVVISKNVSNRKMRQTLLHPKILLLSCPIVYQRYEKKMTVLDNILLQETEYIRNLVAKICSYSPDVILVEKTVARIAKEMLFENDITLVCNVKPIVIERVSRFTGAAIVSSIDAQIGVPQLGFCQKFYLQTFNQKTMMYFDGCPPHLGCTVLLRGSSYEELKKIKSICSFMVFADFNWQLERSFLMDEYCCPKEVIETKGPQTLSVITSNSDETKLETRKTSTVIVEDNSDPLRSMATDSNPRDVSSPVIANEIHDQLNDDFSEMTAKLTHYLSTLQLSCSPFISIPLPYLMTNCENNAKIRKYFNPKIIWSKKFENNSSKTEELLKVENELRNREHSSPMDAPVIKKHPFLTRNIKLVANSHEIKSLVADFRANGSLLSHLNQWKTINDKPEERENGPKEEQIIRIDALNPRFHQHLAVLFSSFSYASSNAPNYCVKPWVINMDFYGSNDIPLGGFLERYCFRPSYTCPSSSCSTPMIEHVRRFVHYKGCVLIVLRQLQQNVEAANNSIITWSWCQKCKTGTPYSNLSTDSWLLSFAKYLELKFHGISYRRRGTSSSAPCMDHSLHMDHFQFFAYKQVVASFKYMPIQIHEITLPPTRISIGSTCFSKTEFIDSLKQIAVKGYEIYSLILEKLCSIKDETNGTKYEIIVNEFKAIEEKERGIFRQKIEEIQITLTSSASEDIDDAIVYRLEDSLINLKKLIAESVLNWNLKIQDFVANKKKEEKLSAKSGLQSTATTVTPKSPPISGLSVDDPTILSINDSSSNLEEISANSRTVSISSGASLLSSSEAKPEVSPTEVLKACIEEQEKECEETLKALENIIEESDLREDESKGIERRDVTTFSVSSYGYDIDLGINDCLENGVDFEANSDNYAVYNVCEANDDNHSFRSSTNTNCSEVKANSSQSSAIKSDISSFTVTKIFKELLTNANNLIINNPFPLSEHYLLPTHREDIAFIVKDNDPGSIIAYALTSSEYERQLNELIRQSSSPLIKRKTTASVDIESTIELSTNKTTSNAVSPHIDLQYNDSNAKFYCCVYFAEHFRRFRAHIFGSSNSEELYIRSLTNCVLWKARGGKSGLTFCKTVNDRFILKEMSKPELQSFLNIAGYYFDYCTRAIDESRPSMLARIVGIYRTSYKNTATNNASKLYLLVMENLFYRRDISQKFDLKGSMRNRLVNTNSANVRADQLVLLDENLMQMTCDCPLYVYSHSKEILRAAIDNDSLFLSSHSVMDYSLLVGIDDNRNQFVVGIIDYIRPFTWDKKLESVVKSVGSQGRLPTIVQPDLYRIRFCEAMDQYFLCVPDKWHTIVSYR